MERPPWRDRRDGETAAMASPSSERKNVRKLPNKLKRGLDSLTTLIDVSARIRLAHVLESVVSATSIGTRPVQLPRPPSICLHPPYGFFVSFVLLLLLPFATSTS